MRQGKIMRREGEDANDYAQRLREAARVKSQNAAKQPRSNGKFLKKGNAVQAIEGSQGGGEQAGEAEQGDQLALAEASALAVPKKRKYEKKRKKPSIPACTEERIPVLPAVVLATVHFRQQSGQPPLLKAEYLPSDKLMQIPGASQFSTVPGKPCLAPFHHEASDILKELEEAKEEANQAGEGGFVLKPRGGAREHPGAGNMAQVGEVPLVFEAPQAFRPCGKAPNGENGLPKDWDPAAGCWVEADPG